MTQHSIGPSWKVIGPATTRVELSGRGFLVQVTYLEIDQKAQARRGTPVPRMCD